MVITDNKLDNKIQRREELQEGADISLGTLPTHPHIAEAYDQRRGRAAQRDEVLNAELDVLFELSAAMRSRRKRENLHVALHDGSHCVLGKLAIDTSCLKLGLVVGEASGIGASSVDSGKQFGQELLVTP